MDIQITQKQIPALSPPKMILSINILQMGTQELLEHIETVIQENPVLEAIESSDNNFQRNGPPLKLEWMEAADLQNRTHHRQDQEAGSNAWYPVLQQQRSGKASMATCYPS